jgi:SAM-dependent methyltransferase
MSCGYNDRSALLFAGIVGKALQEAARPRRTIDIGCAKGYLVNYLYSLGIDAYGLDISIHAISCADQQIKERLFVVDAEEGPLPFPDNYADLISALEVLEHLQSFKWITSEIRRILQKGGYLLISTPNPYGRFAKMDPTHISVKPRRYWAGLFAKEGFIPAEQSVWETFRMAFLREFRKAMQQNPPTTKISAMLQRMGSAGCALRSLFPYIDYFSPLRSDEILLLKKLP